MQCYVCI